MRGLHQPATGRDGLQACNAILEVRIIEVGNAALDGVVKPFKAQVCLRRPFVQLGDVGMAALGAFLPPVENGC